MQIGFTTKTDGARKVRLVGRQSTGDLAFDVIGDSNKESVYSDMPLEAAIQLRDALSQEILVAQGPGPLIREADPEFERLLAKKEAIEAGILCTKLGDVRFLTEAFTDACPLSGTHEVKMEWNPKSRKPHLTIKPL